jgi:hypothetical protein
MKTRKRQRELGVVSREVASRRERNLSTFLATIHVDADTLDLAVEKTELFKDYSPEQRRRMAKEGRAMPDGSFPIADCEDAQNARRSVGRAKPEKRDAVQAHIKKRMRALRCNLSAAAMSLAWDPSRMVEFASTTSSETELDREISYQINFFYDHGYWSDVQLSGGPPMEQMDAVMNVAVLVATKPQNMISQVTRDRLTRKGFLQ